MSDENQFDVFLCHNSKDKPEVIEIAHELFFQFKIPHIFVNAGGFKRFVQAAHFKTIQQLCY